jgi:hypothetical protein
MGSSAIPVDVARYGGTSADGQDRDVASLGDQRAQRDPAVDQDPKCVALRSFPEELGTGLRVEAASELGQACLGLLAEAR